MAPEVWLVDDDPSVRKALARVLSLGDYRVRTLASGAELLDAWGEGGRAGCMILDLQLPDTDGLTLQARLNEQAAPPPVVFLTAHGDIPATVRAMKSGATEFLTKPVSDVDLLRAVGEAMARSVANGTLDSARRAFRNRYDSLTPREREVMGLVVRGRLNKQIAMELGTVEQTIKVHRGRVMKKMGVESVAELVVMTERHGPASVV